MAQAKSVPNLWKTAFVIVVFLLFLLLTIPYVPLRSNVSRTYSGGIWDPESSTMGAEVTASMEAVRTRYLLRSHASEMTGTITLEGAGLDGSHTLWIRDPDDVTAADWTFHFPALDQGGHSTLALGPYTQNSFDFREDFSAVVIQLYQDETYRYLVLTESGTPSDVAAEYTAAWNALRAE